jgi:hydrogenase maturation protein HypF
MGDAGVEVVVEGEKQTIERFIKALRIEHPPLARIENVKVTWKPATGEFTSFQVLRSEKSGLGFRSVVPPDIALCNNCLSEMLNREDRRYLYPFITCVDCGPRFTIIRELPYDRPLTSMDEFPLCADCSREYKDPANRRYHAEPTCCPACGPQMKLYDKRGHEVNSPKPLRGAARLLDEGKIIAIKGIGGIHIAAKATGDEVLARLRKAFNRPQQPFAVMSPDLETVRTFAEVNEYEAKLLTSYRRPIVVLKRSRGYMLSKLVAPGLDSVGVMLPYSGIHYLLLHYGKEPAYVMTSANVAGLPMIIDNVEALTQLRGAVDYFLLHDRTIVNRCDDSVIKTIDDRPVFLRRSRGYVPEPIKLAFKSDSCVLALGAELNVTTSILIDDLCFLSQHIGDTTHVETIGYLQQATERLMGLLNLNRAGVVAHDLHPNYATTRIAQEIAAKFRAKTLAVQHHHAHLGSLMAEHGLEELVGIAADGVGYGTDGTVWGGEVMVANLKSFEHVGGLRKQPMPGGDLATQFPARMVAGILWQVLEPREVEHVLKEFCANGLKYGAKEIGVVLRQLERNLNVFRTSSCGRVLDAAACLLGICDTRTYEGEPAIKLEAAASGSADRVKLEPILTTVDGMTVVDTSALLRGVVDALRANIPRKHIASAVQRALATGLARIAIEAAQTEGIGVIGGSGGVFYNRAITSTIADLVAGAGLKFVRHGFVPPGDGGVSVGQAVIAAKSC